MSPPKRGRFIANNIQITPKGVLFVHLKDAIDRGEQTFELDREQMAIVWDSLTNPLRKAAEKAEGDPVIPWERPDRPGGERPPLGEA